VLTNGWSKVKKAERRGLFTRLAKRMGLQRKAANKGLGRGSNEGPGRGAYQGTGRDAYQGTRQRCIPRTWKLRGAYQGLGGGAYQGLVQGDEGGEERPVHQIGEENECVSIKQLTNG
jgi:hypothetical protein